MLRIGDQNFLALLVRAGIVFCQRNALVNRRKSIVKCFLDKTSFRSFEAEARDLIRRLFSPDTGIRIVTVNLDGRREAPMRVTIIFVRHGRHARDHVLNKTLLGGASRVSRIESGAFIKAVERVRILARCDNL